MPPEATPAVTFDLPAAGRMASAAPATPRRRGTLPSTRLQGKPHMALAADIAAERRLRLPRRKTSVLPSAMSTDLLCIRPLPPWVGTEIAQLGPAQLVASDQRDLHPPAVVAVSRMWLLMGVTEAVLPWTRC